MAKNNHLTPHDARPDNLRIDGHCPICGTLYDFRKLHVLKEQDGASLLYITCGNCLGACVATMSVGPSGPSLVGTVTELSESEVLDMRERDTVTPEDVLDLNRLLAEDRPI